MNTLYILIQLKQNGFVHDFTVTLNEVTFHINGRPITRQYDGLMYSRG